MTKEDEFERREKFLRKGFLKNLDYQDSDATIKLNAFSPEYSSTRFIFWIELMIEEIELVVAEEYKFVNGAK